jgi:hypothetical protein
LAFVFIELFFRVCVASYMMDDKRVPELLAEILTTQNEMLKTQNAMLGRLESVEKQQMKTNVLLGEHTRAIMKLAEKIEQIPEVLNRIAKLEAAVFH